MENGGRVVQETKTRTAGKRIKSAVAKYQGG